MSETTTEPKEITAADILGMANARPKVKWIQHPEYGRLRIRILRGFERDSYDTHRYAVSAASDGDEEYRPKNIRAALAVRGLAKNDEGERMFPQDDVAEIVGKVGGPFLDWVYDEIMAFNQMRLADRKVLEKNSESGPSAASGSSSPATSEAAPSLNGSSA